MTTEHDQACDCAFCYAKRFWKVVDELAKEQEQELLKKKGSPDARKQ